MGGSSSLRNREQAGGDLAANARTDKGCNTMWRLQKQVAVAMGCLALVATACSTDDTAGEEAPSEATASTAATEGADETPSSEASADPASGADWDAVVEAAREEGTLTYYVAQAEDVTVPTLDAFEEAYPEIDVEFLRLPSTPLAGRFAEEKSAGTVAADAIMLGAPDLINENPDWFVDLSPDVLPSLADYPSESWSEDSFDVTLTTQIAIYNTEAVDEAPETWFDATDESWAGRTMLTDPRSTGVYVEWALGLHEEYGDEIFERMAALDAPLAESGVTAAQQVAAGAYDLAYPVHLSHGVALKAEGAPVDFAHMTDIAPGFPLVIALPEDAPNPNAARVFANWMLSADAQTVNCAQVTTPVNPDADPEGNCPGMPETYRPAQFSASEAEIDAILGVLGLD